MSTTPIVRDASPADATAVRAIYLPYVESTAVSFEIDPPSVEELADRIRRALADWAWLVAEVNGQTIGYAYATAHRSRAAYRWSVETSAYVREDHHRRGVAKALYLRLFDDLEGKGFCNAYAGITLPNPASVALHESLGFRQIGVFPRVGRKFGRWHDVAWFHRPLRAEPVST